MHLWYGPKRGWSWHPSATPLPQLDQTAHCVHIHKDIHLNPLHKDIHLDAVDKALSLHPQERGSWHENSNPYLKISITRGQTCSIFVFPRSYHRSLVTDLQKRERFLWCRVYVQKGTIRGSRAINHLLSTVATSTNTTSDPISGMWITVHFLLPNSMFHCEADRIRWMIFIATTAI